VVDIAGGASTVRQALGSGALDELVVDIIPVVLGWGESMFGDITNLVLIPVEVAQSPYATHIRYQVGPHLPDGGNQWLDRAARRRRQ
jgi:dihydrofolate reductase